jgi:AcrR family transcriptional regulator
LFQSISLLTFELQFKKMADEEQDDKLATSTEEKIKTAARKLFTQKGFSAVKTRDIANEAGINLALLNYYFRSKEKLYEMVMLENMGKFRSGLAQLFSDESLELFEKIDKLVAYYIDTFIENPDLPLFIANELNKGHHEIFSEKDGDIFRSREVFIRQLNDESKNGKVKSLHPLHFFTNLMGMILMPFIAKPMVSDRMGLNEDDFKRMLEERKKMIPAWIKLIVEREKDDLK